jgi:hypothetical protein
MREQPINILLVEDDEVDVMNVQRAFKKGNIHSPLYIAANGLEALALLRGTESQPSPIPSQRRLILLDLNMPRMGGIEFLHRLRADPALKQIPVVILTTSNEEGDRLNAYALNVAGYILKPVTFANFSQMMQTLNHYWSLCEMV